MNTHSQNRAPYSIETDNLPDHGVASPRFWEQIRQGDEQAYASLYNAYAEMLYSYGMKIVNNEQRVVDAIQNLFVTLFEKRANLSRPLSIKAYLCVSLRRLLLNGSDQRPQESSMDDRSTDNYSFQIELDMQAALEQEEFKEQQLVALQTAIDQLSNQQREILYLKYYKEMSADEIAQIMGIQRQVVYNVLSRALARLRENKLLTNSFLRAILTFVKLCGL